jgi:hypothetical protein
MPDELPLEDDADAAQEELDLDLPEAEEDDTGGTGRG